MKRLVVVLLVLAVANAVRGSQRGLNPRPHSFSITDFGSGGVDDGHCKSKRILDPRPHSVSITDFGAVGDGMTLNTLAFQNAIFYLRSFADKGGAQLYVPKGRWLTGSFNLTSHLTLFLDKDAVIVGTQVYADNYTLGHSRYQGTMLEVPYDPDMPLHSYNKMMK